MKRNVAALLLFGLCSQGACRAQAPAQVREPAVAGAFYPADPAELTRLVDGLLAKAPPPQLPDVVALVAPHAGYMYSADVAAHAFAAVKGRKIERVVVISPSHIDAFPYSAVYDGQAYATPLGRIPVDRAFGAALAKSSKSIQLSERGHRAAGGGRSTPWRFSFLSCKERWASSGWFPSSWVIKATRPAGRSVWRWRRTSAVRRR